MQPDVAKISLPASDEFKAFWKEIIQRAVFQDEKIVLLYEDSLVNFVFSFVKKCNLYFPPDSSQQRNRKHK
jgi:hypothetical protein